MKPSTKSLIATAVLAVLAALPAAAGAAPKHLPCNPEGQAAVLTVRPSACTLLPKEVRLENGLNLGRLKWLSFGDRTARFTGIDKDFHEKPRHIRVSGFAYRPRPATCGSRKIVYTRVFFKTKFRSGTVRADRCIGR